MPFDIYWFEDSKYLQMYIDVFRDNQKRIHEDNVDNLKTQSWLHGFYVREALLSTVGNMFNKGTKFQYPNKPYDGENKVPEIDEEKQRREEALLQKNYMEMLEWTNYFNTRNKEQNRDSE